MTISAVSFYVTGGTVQRDAPCYVERQADAALYSGLMQGSFCYVLTSRQMGKSSLMVRTAVKLREEGVAVAVLDLTAIGQNLNPEQWYNGLLNQIGQRLDLEDELYDFAYEHKQLSPLQRWMRTIREVVLVRYSGRVVIFVDEIDAVRSLPFSTDEFFAGIREFYNARTEDPELERLTFCLLGVATPSDLIRDTRTTPFNIGQRIELYDFTVNEAASLARGLMREERLAGELLNRILYWTGGHPYLTQKLCQGVAEDRSINSAAGVDELCSRLFFSHRAQEKDDNLLFVRERILRSETDLAGLLELYKRVYRRGRVRDEATNRFVDILRLSGITRVEESYLRVRNRIYQRVFDLEWIKANMPDAEKRRQQAAYRRGLLQAVLVSAVIIAIMSGLLFFAVKQRIRAEKQQIRAERQEEINRRQLYASQIAFAYQWWEKGNVGQAKKLLENHIPESNREDLRGFEWHYLWRLCHSDLFTLRHTSVVLDVAFSPDGKMLATGSLDSTAKLWDVATGRELAALKGHTKGVTGVAFSPDGKILATGSADSTAKLWDVATGRELAALKGHTNVIYGVAFSPDGKMLATRSRDSTAKLWDVATGRELAVLKGHTKEVIDVAFSPDGKMLATGSADSTAKLWDVATGRELAALKGHTNVIYGVAFSPDGKMLATRSRDSTAKLWDVATGRELAALKGHTYWVTGVAFSPDGKMLATGNTDSTAKLWDVATGRELATLKGHTNRVLGVAFSPDGKMLATGSDDFTAKLWDVATGRELAVLKGHIRGVYGVAFSPDGKILATRSDDSTAKLWDVATGREMAALKGHTNGVNGVAFSPDGKMLATGSSDSTAKLWDVAAAKKSTFLKGHTSYVQDIAFSPDGKTLATASMDQTVKLWDAVSGQQLATLAGHMDSVNSVAFSPDGKMLASAGDDATVKLWEVDARRNVADFKGHRAMVNEAAFSPDGKILATASSDRTVKLWDTATGRVLKTLTGHADSVYSVQFSPDGKKLATGSWDKTIKIWDVNSGRELAALKGQSKKINQILFSTDGKVLVSVGSDSGGVSEIKLWDFASMKEVAAIPESNLGYTNNRVALSPDGKRLIIASGNNLKLWDVEFGQELVAFENSGSPIYDAAVSPDGKTIAFTGSNEKTVKLWRSTKDEEASTSKSATATSNAFTPVDLLNLDFEQGEPGQFPVGWSSNRLHKEDGFTAKLTQEGPKRGRQCALLTRDMEKSSVLKRDERNLSYVTLKQGFEARAYCGKRVRFRAAVRIEAAEPGAIAALWLRSDRSNGQPGFFDNMDNRPIRSSEWGYYEIVGKIDEDTEWLNIGLLLNGGEGKVWIDDVSFEVIDK